MIPLLSNTLVKSVSPLFVLQDTIYDSLIRFQVGNLEFPSKRFFGNRAESFVRLRRAQLEVYYSDNISLTFKV